MALAQPSSNTSALARLAALVFCRADILLEVSDSFEIKYCIGTTQKYFGRREADLYYISFLDLFHIEDARVIQDLFSIRKQGARIDDTHVRAKTKSGDYLDVAFSGYRVPDFNNNFFIAIKVATKPFRASGRRELDRDDVSGMLQKDSFVDLAGERIASYEAAGGSPKLSMIKITDAGEGLAEPEKKKMMGALGDIIKAESLGGDTAGLIDGENFSLVHGDATDTAALSERLSNALSGFTGSNVQVLPKIATLDASGTEMDGQQIAKALMVSLQSFADGNGSLKGTDLNTVLQAKMLENMEAIDRFKIICSTGRFNLVYMPVCSLKTGALHHFEALTRFPDEAGESPFGLITLAEEIGIITEFDLAVAKRAIETAVQQNDASLPSMAINISGHSIGHSGFCKELEGLLSGYFDLDQRLSLEITESAKIEDLEGVNQAIQRFRRMGHQVALDDFGAGAASFDYLNSFDVDTVKFDGPVVKRASVTRKGKAFLASMATLCREIGVETIAEMVEDQPLANFLSQCGINLGQGWHFGKPHPDMSTFPKILPAPHD